MDLRSANPRKNDSSIVLHRGKKGETCEVVGRFFCSDFDIDPSVPTPKKKGKIWIEMAEHAESYKLWHGYSKKQFCSTWWFKTLLNKLSLVAASNLASLSLCVPQVVCMKGVARWLGSLNHKTVPPPKSTSTAPPKGQKTKEVVPSLIWSWRFTEPCFLQIPGEKIAGGSNTYSKAIQVKRRNQIWPYFVLSVKKNDFQMFLNLTIENRMKN